MAEREDDSVNDVREPRDFIRQIIDEDMKTGKWDGKVVTRFPPEPNAYLHIGHAKAASLNFGIAKEYGGEYHLRFDDTNPSREEAEYVESIREDLKWLGLDWGEHEYYASDYFEAMYDYAVELVKKGKAYVCELSAEEVREYRGTLTEPGKESPYRNRSMEENMDLFERMKAGEFENGSKVLRAKIDMANPNLNMRDPVMYRIAKVSHHRTGDKWCIYPMYDWAHGLEDSLEGITHSICSLEFEDHRPLYDWYLDELGVHHPQQIEFARMNISYMMTSKRKLLKLIEGGYVKGWDDPRMPTLSGLRRRGYSPASILNFCDRAGVAKRNKINEIAMLEHCLREDLNKHSNRVMAVLRPLKVVIENFEEGKIEELDAVNNPEDEGAGMRKVPFTREIYIERDDFMEDAPKKFFRLALGREVRLRYAYYVTCRDVVKDESGEVVEVRCTYDPETRGGSSPDRRKVKGTLHWVSAAEGLDAEVRLYDYLFTKEDADDVEESEDFTSNVNHDSLEVLTGCKVEPSLKGAEAGSRYQFERVGYFCVDLDSADGALVFNRTIGLRDSWKKKMGKK